MNYTQNVWSVVVAVRFIFHCWTLVAVRSLRCRDSGVGATCQLRQDWRKPDAGKMKISTTRFIHGQLWYRMSEPEKVETAIANPPMTESPPESYWPADVPRDALEEDKAATVNTDGEVTAYPATPEPIPETIRKRRANRAKVPKGWVLKARRRDGKTGEYWQAVAEMLMDETGESPIPPDLWREQVAGRYAMMESYTTLERLKMAVEKCEGKLAEKNLSEQLQIEWMNALRGCLQMQKEHIEELKKSAAVAEKKKAITKPKNLPPVIIQQNFGGNGQQTTPAKVIDEAKAIGDTVV